MDAGELVGSGHRYAVRVVRSGPYKFGVWLSLASVALLLIPARLAGVHSIPLSGDDVGVWWQANWSLMYVLILPAIFGSFVALAYAALKALQTLCSPNRGVIVRTDGTEALDYPEYVASQLRLSARTVFITALILAIVLSIIDLWSVAVAAKHWRQTGTLPADVERDWSVAFGFMHVPFAKNITFDVLAYFVQGVAIFLGFFCLMKFWLFMQTFSNSLRDERHPFELRPWLYDPECRLGLKPVGNIFNIFLVLIIAFETYVVAHRVQQIGMHGNYRVNDYLNLLFKGRNTFTSVLNWRLYAWDSVDAGTWLLLILMTLPLIAVAYLPLWQLRKYVKRMIEKFYDSDMLALERAKESGEKTTADRLEERIKCWLKAQVWPNGDAAGWRLLGATVAVSVAAWAPPLFVWLVSAGILSEVLGRILGKKKEK